MTLISPLLLVKGVSTPGKSLYFLPKVVKWAESGVLWE